MDNKFLQVFPKLKLNNETIKLLDNVIVTKVVTNRPRNKYVIYLESTVLIGFNTLAALENEISEGLSFRKNKVEVKLEPSYILSSQYTPENLWNSYKASIIKEIGSTNHILATCLKRARYSFDGKKMRITIENQLVYTSKEKEIVETISKIFNERCNVETEVQIEIERETFTEEEKRIQKEKQYEISRILKEAGVEDHSVMHKEDRNEQENIDSIKKSDNTLSNPDEELAAKAAKEAMMAIDTMQTKPSKETNNTRKSAFKGNNFRRRKPLGDDPGQIYGSNFDDPVTAVKDLDGGKGEVVIDGQICFAEAKETRSGKYIYTFNVTDFTDTISVKMFMDKDEFDDYEPSLKKGKFIKVKGALTIDKFSGELTLMYPSGIKESKDTRTKRIDTSLEKRVELHLHTNMSDNDAIASAEQLIDTAMRWDMNAMAITDHGVVNAFTDAAHCIDKLKKKYPGHDDFKIIYGMEGYVVDDKQKIVFNSKKGTLDDQFVVFDLETTGYSKIADKIIEIGAVKIKNGQIVDRFSEFVNPKIPIPYKITELTSIKDSDVINAKSIEDVLPRFMEFCANSALVAHNAGFDIGFIKQNCMNQSLDFDFMYLDTVMLSRTLLPTLKKFKLDSVAKELGVSLENHHRAVDDAECTAQIFIKLSEKLKDKGIVNTSDINHMGDMDINSIRRLHRFHIILIAKNEIGRVNLYRLVSLSNLKYYNKRPQIPKSELIKYREGLIIGSACEAGELYRALLEGKDDERISELCNFYDYFEIQPIGNNQFMIPSTKITNIHNEEDLRNMNRRIVALGEKFNKPVVATCDVHFLEPEDEIHRRILMAGQKFDDADNQPPLYFRTTDEMLDEFDYLGSEKAREVVITNTNKIADMVEYIEPVRRDKCPPVIPNSDKDLRDICYNTAKEMYGEDLPNIVKNRLDVELDSIINNGYSVMYIIAQKLVKHSNENGYLVGSRGSVGSSFAATMSGITEVNPLQPHYRCPKCKYSDFESEIVQKFVKDSACGMDMPDKVCPICGEPLLKEGFNIPFETFLGFSGDKEPDIDLNFSGEFQAQAHKYTEVIFGEGQTFKAGTVGTVAEKTAYGYVKNYYEEHDDRKRSAEIDRIKDGLVGIKRTSGQHPGGIIVLPHGDEINTFTPVQHPANDVKSDIITTHFDYHSIDHNLLKLDILGHDDPTMIRFLEDITGVDAKKIPLDDKDVMSLFESTEALGVKPEDIHGCPLGCMGVPEFGTDNTINMVMEVKPKSLSDLVRISGLSHGTDVWSNNAQELIRQGTADISTVISTRDDIMVYLINHGLDKAEAFKIMEMVRKGKVAKGGVEKWPEWKQDMLDHGVPEWYIWSCEQIKYMFPKAHAAAYVMMGYRIAWFKINYPREYYAAFFGIRAKGFNYDMMCHGKDRVEYEYDRLSKLIETHQATQAEEATFKDLKIVQEMYARGYEFTPIDIYKAKANRFQVIDGKVMPAFNTIDSLGDTAAFALERAAKQGEFLSQDDIRAKASVPTKVLEYMDKEGILGNLSKSNQISLFDNLF